MAEKGKGRVGKGKVRMKGGKGGRYPFLTSNFLAAPMYVRRCGLLLQTE